MELLDKCIYTINMQEFMTMHNYSYSKELANANNYIVQYSVQKFWLRLANTQKFMTMHIKLAIATNS